MLPRTGFAARRCCAVAPPLSGAALAGRMASAAAQCACRASSLHKMQHNSGQRKSRGGEASTQRLDIQSRVVAIFPKHVLLSMIYKSLRRSDAVHFRSSYKIVPLHLVFTDVNACRPSWAMALTAIAAMLRSRVHVGWGVDSPRRG